VGARISRLRQQLRTLAERRWQRLQQLLALRGGLIRGSFGVRARICGNPGCRCAQGERHESRYLSAKVDGRTRLVHVPASDELRVAQGVARYQRWRHTRNEIAQLDVEQLQLIDELGHELLEAYPPNNPIPPARKRGRKPKGDGGEPNAAG